MPERRFWAGNRGNLLIFAWMVLAASAPVMAQTAVRDLSDFEGLHQTFTIAIQVTPPPGTIAFGVEDSPPDNWTDVSNIDNSGSWDAVNGKVKWGPFFSDDPITLHYDLFADGRASGQGCFFGIVSLDGSNQSVEGDLCLPRPVPAASEWALVCFALLLLIAGDVVVKARPTAPAPGD